MTTKAQADQLMTIGQVAQATAVTTPTLRYYEEEGILLVGPLMWSLLVRSRE